MNDPHDTEQPSEKRLGKAAVGVVLIGIAIIVVIFIGMNLSHDKEMDHKETTGVETVSGGLQ